MFSDIAWNPRVFLLLLLLTTLTVCKTASLDEQLLQAARDGNTQSAITLLNEGANVNARNQTQWTPLMMAAEKGHTETVKALLDKKADVNAKDRIGTTALMMAIRGGYPTTVIALLDGGANANEIDQGGNFGFDSGDTF